MASSFLPSIFIMLLLLHFLQFHKSAYAHDANYEECKRPFQCGNVSLSYPFYDGENRPPHCGYPGFQINCSNSMPEISMSSEIYYLLSMDATSDTISVARQSYWHDLCPRILFNTSINFNLYKYTSVDDNITLFYNCPITSSTTENQIPCINRTYSPVGYIMTQNLESSQAKSLYETCPNNILVSVPVLNSLHGSITDIPTLMEAFQNGFGLQWVAENEVCDSCRGSGGECGYDTNLTKFTCYCPDGPSDAKCSTGGNASQAHKVYIAAGVAAGAIIAILGMLVLARYFKTKHSADNQDIDAFLKKLEPGVKRYTYRSLKKFTSSFTDKLGEGGFGAVYKGKLPDGDLVAVKLLKEPKGNAEDFINEVRSIGRTNHVNIVRLLGFCFEGRRRALVFDFMPNGSLEKFIGGNINYQSLAWDKLFQIAVGIARGLEYLHRGCNTGIVHFDIKPHNILLDGNFCPKISDFGLAKTCRQNVSVVSMSGARGTAGFIAPELLCQSFGAVSHKSDVYSYGMLVIDMVGCRHNVNAEFQHSSEQYFPHWIYKQVEQPEELDHQYTSNGEEKGTLRKMMLVSLHCIQANPSSRPTMTRVVEMLEGPLGALKIPPMPSLSSPPISQSNASIRAIIPR